MNFTRIITLSDTHGNYNVFNEIILTHRYQADCFIYLGDGYAEYQQICQNYPEIKIYGVRGNNDFFCDLPSIDTIEIAGKKIAFTHGHNYYVKSGLKQLINSANNICADIILYGHTHESFTNFDNSLYIMNPGCANKNYAGGTPSYGIIDIQGENVVLNIVKL